MNKKRKTVHILTVLVWILYIYTYMTRLDYSNAIDNFPITKWTLFLLPLIVMTMDFIINYDVDHAVGDGGKK